MAQKQPRVWTRAEAKPKPPSAEEKQAIVAACDAFLDNVLKPRFLRPIKPAPFNYPVDIRGSWRAGSYCFVQRYRSGMEHNIGEEFDAPFARITCAGPGRFDIYWMRHTGKWWKLHSGKRLNEALEVIETDEVLHPN